MSTEFEYEFVGKGKFGDIHRPVAKVSFQSKDGHWTETWMVIDTGADFSILPKYLSYQLGISLEKDCFEDETIGVGGEQKVYFLKQKITCKIGHMKRSVPLAFFSNNNVPPLLGRLGFLETFDALFSKKRKVIFKD